MDLTDQEYVERCRNGEADDFRFLVQRYQGPLFSYLASRLGDRSLAEEAAQEAFVRAFFALRKLRKPASFHAWLLGIASRVAKEFCRSLTRHKRATEALAVGLTETSDPQPEYRLDEAIAALPEAYRQVILLRYYEELSCQEVADRLALPLGTVTKTLSRAYAQLRQMLAPNESLETRIHAEVEP